MPDANSGTNDEVQEAVVIVTVSYGGETFSLSWLQEKVSQALDFYIATDYELTIEAREVERA